MILQPCYNFPQPNESILINKTKTSVSAKGKVYEGDAEVRLDLLPNARIHIYVSLPESADFFGLKDVKTLALSDRDIPGFCVKVRHSSSDNSTLIWCPRTEPIIGRGDQSTQIVAVVFHLFDYKEFWGTRRPAADINSGQCVIDHVDLKFSGWNVELKSLPTTPDTLKTLRETGGYGLTHIGCLKKEDGSSFDGKTAKDILNALRLFFSFSKGMWCNPCLAVGFDDKENRVWEAWSSPQGHWNTPISWFDPHHCDQLVNLFLGFMTKWENEDWREALQKVIYWYLSSNCSTLGLGIGIDAGIILTQAAIERLSFEYAAVYKKLISEDGFKNKSFRASDKLRLLFSSLDIPIDIPASLPELQKLAKQKQWSDAPRTITEVRNSFIHPKDNVGSITTEALFEAWNLGQWYLELALLRICDYSGTYSNRLVLQKKWEGDVETVPWDNSKVK
jgi:hypothetical protein